MKNTQKNISKYIILLFAFLLMFSNLEFMAIPTEAHDARSTPQSITKKGQDQNLNDYQPTDKVNVVIELREKSGVIHAQETKKSFSELSEKTQHSLHMKSVSEQEHAKKIINSKDISIEYLDSFTAIFNGFSANILFKDIEVIEQIDHVKAVYISEEYEQPVEPIKELKISEEDQTEATSANEIVNAPKVWEDIGYTGEGKIVAVIDRGIDVDHRDMILSDETDPGLGEDDVKKKADEQELLGRYFTEKVPYGYNYADKNDTIKNIGEGASGHGIHVSGIVGANGDLDNGGIKGVAPEVQILGMKVYSNDQKSLTNSSIYVKAIDDAIKLDADAINISFGTTGRILNPEDPAQIAAKRATENGTFVAKSAGNGYYFGEGHDELPYTANPDLGVISNAQLAESAVEVANFENTHLDYEGLVFSADGEDDQIIPFNPARKAPSPDDAIDKDKREIVYVGYGRMPGDSNNNPEANDYEGIDVEGKIALIKRGGGVGYTAKTLNAQEHGADAVIVFNKNDSGYKNMASNSDVKIPQVFILRKPGEDMVKELESGNNATIAFENHRVKVDNPRTGKMANSTSWGPMGGLDFKPAITSAGSQILSTLNDDSYGVKSGTSMAAPQVAGGSTLIMTYIQENFDVSGLDLTIMTKNILMNTAKPIENISDTNKEFNVEDVSYSPRRQGAGLMDLYAAVTTPVVITDKQSGQGGVALKEIGDTFTFSLEAINNINEDVVYNVEGNIQADLTEGKHNYLESVGIINENGDIPIVYSSNHGREDGEDYQLTIPANKTVQLDVTVDLSGTVDEYTQESIKEHFINGRFIEGLIEFHNPQDIHPELSVPYVGFYGDWNQPPVLDAFNYDKKETYYSKAGMVSDHESDDYPYLGVNPITEELTDHYAISPHSENGSSNIIPALTFLRNAQEVQFSILDKDDKELKHLKTLTRVRKHHDPSSPYTIFDDISWDGEIDGQVVEDGLYYYAIKTRIDYDDADWQVTKVPVYIDTEKPNVNGDMDLDTNEVQWNAKDEGSGLASVEVLVNGESASGLLPPDETSYTIEDQIYDINIVEVIIADWAGNEEIITVYDPEPSSAYMIDIIEELEADEKINSEASHPFTIHLKAVNHFEEQERPEKVIKHMKGFQVLLEHHYNNDLVSDVANNILRDKSELIIEQWDHK